MDRYLLGKMLLGIKHPRWFWWSEAHMTIRVQDENEDEDWYKKKDEDYSSSLT